MKHQNSVGAHLRLGLDNEVQFLGYWESSTTKLCLSHRIVKIKWDHENERISDTLKNEKSSNYLAVNLSPQKLVVWNDTFPFSQMKATIPQRWQELSLSHSKGEYGAYLKSHKNLEDMNHPLKWGSGQGEL